MPIECDAAEPVDVPRAREGLCCRQLDDEAVVYDVAHHILHYLNRTAHAIWSRCDGRRTAREIAGLVADAFDIDADSPAARAAVARDVHNTLTDLAASGLIEFDSADPHDASSCYPCPT